MSVEQPTPVTLLYTAALEGRLTLLPTLFTRLRMERQRAEISLLVDLGRACAPGTWICEATDGRGMLVAMDGMGYDSFHIGPLDALYTQPALVQQLQQVITTPLAAGPWTGTSARRGLTFRFANAANPAALSPRAEPADLLVALRLSATPRLEVESDVQRVIPRVVWLDTGLSVTVVDQPVIGRIDLLLLPDAPYLTLIDHRRLALTDDLLPDPTITGVVEFVESEARYALKKRGQAPYSSP
jgi:hypothetical protein